MFKRFSYKKFLFISLLTTLSLSASDTKKIEHNPARPEIIVTVGGIGYRFENETL